MESTSGSAEPRGPGAGEAASANRVGIGPVAAQGTRSVRVMYSPVEFWCATIAGKSKGISRFATRRQSADVDQLNRGTVVAPLAMRSGGEVCGPCS